MVTLTPEQRQIVEAVKAELLAGTSDLSKAPIASASQAQAIAAISADNQLMRLTIDALLNNLALNSGLIQFAGIKAPAKALNSASVVAVASQSYSFSVFLNPSTNKFYIERRNKDGVGPGAVVSCHARWSGGQSDSVSSDVYDMEYYGTPTSTVTPYAGRIYYDAAGHIYVYAANKLTSAIPHDSEIGAGILIRIDSADNKLRAGTAAKTYLTIGPHAVTDISRTGDGDGVIIVDQGKLTFGANVTLGQGSSMKNATVDVDKTTGVLKITNADQTTFGDLQHLTVGSYNTIGSGNKLLSGITIGDNASIGNKVTIESRAIYPANIGITAEYSSLRVYGYEKLLAAGYVPYVFRRTKTAARFHMTRNGHYVNEDNNGNYGCAEKGWHVYGSHRAYRIVEGVLMFSRDDKEHWSKPDESLGFSHEAGDLVQPVINVEPSGRCGMYVTYGHRSISAGATTSDLCHGLRNLKIEYAIAFGLPFESAYRKVTPADMITPLMTFTARFSNAGVGYDSPAAAWVRDPIKNRNAGWHFGE